MSRIQLKSYGKINLSLDIKGKYENGYHKVEMIMQQINLYDDVLIEWFPEGEKGIKVSSNRPYIPNDERNIAYKAAKIMMEKYKKSGQVVIKITKRIPVAAGLAGGSGNGGAVILGLNKLWGKGISLEEMCEIGASLGADVPFTMMNEANSNKVLGLELDPMATPCALAEGTGTILTPLESMKLYVVLSKPPISVSTKNVYKNIKWQEIKEHPNNKELEEGLREKSYKKIKENMVNVLEKYTLSQYDVVMYTKNKMQKIAKDGGVLMSGSGPTVYAIFNDEDEAKKVYFEMRKVNKQTFLTETVV